MKISVAADGRPGDDQQIVIFAGAGRSA